MTITAVFLQFILPREYTSEQNNLSQPIWFVIITLTCGGYIDTVYLNQSIRFALMTLGFATRSQAAPLSHAISTLYQP